MADVKAAHGYKEKVTEDQLINLIESGVQNSIGDWLNSSDLTRERLRSTYEFAGVADFHLAPQGVSSIVDTSTTEVVEAYTAVLSDLFLGNGKLARFMPYDGTPAAIKASKEASSITNYCIFKKNKGWEILQTWIKSSLLWKNAVIRWDYVEDHDYFIEEYEEVNQAKLDELLSDDQIEIVGDLQYKNKATDIDPLNPEAATEELIYTDVRLRRKINKSRVKLENIPPENFRISRDATCIEDAAFVGIQVDMSRSEIRKMWPDVAAKIKDWDSLGEDEQWLGNARYSEDIAARKQVTGQEYWQGSVSQDLFPLEANREITVTECWLRVDRDGDGIAELKHFIIASQEILYEEDVDEIPLASIVPIDIPHEFYGLSMADFTRSSTLASTAILRGFVENTYLTNYSPKLADPNVVDFSALQNMKPKQIIPTNGNPNGAVAALPPEAISTGTVPLLEHLQLIKEQATGMSKAAQGLNDTLYTSGNSEQKLQAVQSASQKRIQHIARRFAETGFKRMLQGVYQTMRRQMTTKMAIYENGVYASVNPANLPMAMDLEVMIDIGENSNANLIQKLGRVGQEVLPALNQAGAGMAVKPEAPAVLATKVMEAMGLDSNDFLEDYNTDEFKEKAAKALEEQSKESQMKSEAERKKVQADVELAVANVGLTKAETKNKMDDNTKQLAVAVDKSLQEWAKIKLTEEKDGATLPPAPDFKELFVEAYKALQMVEMAKEQMAQAPQGQQPQPNGGQ